GIGTLAPPGCLRHYRFAYHKPSHPTILAKHQDGSGSPLVRFARGNAGGEPTMANNEDVDAILARGRITADDVLTLRRRVFLKGVVTADDAEMVFLLNERLEKDADPAWAPFFVEALVDYLVYQVKPSGYISDQNAEWLIAHISRSGHVQTGCELELLV